MSQIKNIAKQKVCLMINVEGKLLRKLYNGFVTVKYFDLMI